MTSCVNLVLAVEYTQASSIWEVLLRAGVIFGGAALAYWIFAVYVPRLTGRKCPECRTPLQREETDEWKTETTATWTRPIARLIRYHCSQCGFSEDRWVKTEWMGRAGSGDDHFTEADAATELRGEVPDRLKRGLGRAQRDLTREPTNTPGADG